MEETVSPKPMIKHSRVPKRLFSTLIFYIMGYKMNIVFFCNADDSWTTICNVCNLVCIPVHLDIKSCPIKWFKLLNYAYKNVDDKNYSKHTRVWTNLTAKLSDTHFAKTLLSTTTNTSIVNVVTSWTYLTSLRERRIGLEPGLFVE